MNKVCPRCKLPKAIYKFGTQKRFKKNETVIIRKTYCKPCDYEYNNERRQKDTIRIKALAAYLKAIDNELTAMICERFMSTGATQSELVEMFGLTQGRIQGRIRKYLKSN